MKSQFSTSALIGRSFLIWLSTGVLAGILWSISALFPGDNGGFGIAFAIAVFGGIYSLPVVVPVFFTLRYIVRGQLSQTAKVALCVGLPFAASVVLTLLFSEGAPVDTGLVVAQLGHLIAGIFSMLRFTRDLRRTGADDSETKTL